MPTRTPPRSRAGLWSRSAATPRIPRTSGAPRRSRRRRRAHRAGASAARAFDNELVITHGNGPVVGKIMMRQMLTMDRIPPMSMDICVAHSQGGIGYLLMQAIENALREIGNRRHVASLLTQVEVDADDPAFQNPTKFVGPFFSEEEAGQSEPNSAG